MQKNSITNLHQIYAFQQPFVFEIFYFKVTEISPAVLLVEIYFSWFGLLVNFHRQHCRGDLSSLKTISCKRLVVKSGNLLKTPFRCFLVACTKSYMDWHVEYLNIFLISAYVHLNCCHQEYKLNQVHQLNWGGGRNLLLPQLSSKNWFSLHLYSKYVPI